jgi:hypothetical protein
MSKVIETKYGDDDTNEVTHDQKDIVSVELPPLTLL